MKWMQRYNFFNIVRMSVNSTAVYVGKLPDINVSVDSPLNLVRIANIALFS